MKGFPNQVADLGKLSLAMRCIVRLVDNGEPARDDGVLGEELVRAEVAGTGHVKIPVEEYIRQQIRKPISGQSFRTTARGLRELFRLLRFIDDSTGLVVVTELGRQAADFAGQPLDGPQIMFWRRAIQNVSHEGGDGRESHPYQVLLELVQRKPGITRAKCALALEAQDDSAEELDRIVRLADLAEHDIRRQIHVSKSNWDNAKKVLPKFAEQLRDVIRTGDSYVLADAPGRADAGGARERVLPRAGRQATPRAPRTSRAVTPETIAQAGTVERFQEAQIPPNLDPVQAAEAARIRLDRLRRHNQIVQQLALRLNAPGRRLYEDPFDVLVVIEEIGILAEVKTLDGTSKDEQDLVREALAQLLYYDAFLRPSEAADVTIHKIACFESRISEGHVNWLNRHGIGVIWREGDRVSRDELSAGLVRPF